MQEVERSKSQFPCFIPRLDIIKANNRPDTEIYIRQKMNALGKVALDSCLLLINLGWIHCTTS